jgi:hypothetical protein
MGASSDPDKQCVCHYCNEKRVLPAAGSTPGAKKMRRHADDLPVCCDFTPAGSLSEYPRGPAASFHGSSTFTTGGGFQLPSITLCPGQ